MKFSPSFSGEMSGKKYIGNTEKNQVKSFHRYMKIKKIINENLTFDKGFRFYIAKKGRIKRLGPTENNNTVITHHF